jgi:hypothetical protein
MTKQTLVALPLAITAHLFIYQRRQMYLWLLYSAVALGLCLVGFVLLYGRDFLAGVLWLQQDTEFSFGRIVANLGVLLKPLTPLLVGLLAFIVLEPRGPVKSVLLLYAGSAAVVGFFLTGGAGVDWNHVYDFIIALVITTALAVYRLGERCAGTEPSRMVAALAAAAVSATVFVALPAKLAEASSLARELDRRQALVGKDIAYLAAQHGPVLCETMALCYWAGKPHEVDIMILRKKLISGAMREDEFRALIDSGYLKVLQFHSGGSTGRSKRLPVAANDYVLQVYESHPNAMGGSFLTPRAPR